VIGDEETLDMDGGDNNKMREINFRRLVHFDINNKLSNLLSTRFGAFYKFNKK
jgi:hypothetical protein